MGNLLSLRSDKHTVETDIFVDFENAKPTEGEVDLYELVSQSLGQAEQLLGQIRAYTGCGPQIAKAISKPGKETEEEAWAAVVPQVDVLKGFYEFSLTLEDVVPKLLFALCHGDPIKNLEEKQAVTKQFADLLHFVLVFDDLKMTNPAIQNDFSYYRRTLNRVKMSDNQTMLANLSVRDELANKMSLFFAVPTPMLNALVSITSDFVGANESVPQANLYECFATMATICHNAVNEPEKTAKFTKPETVAFLLRVMVGLIILYDHINPQGAFVKTSAINMKSCIKVVQAQGGQLKDGLLNALRYTTKHLNDEDTPKNIKQLLA